MTKSPDYFGEIATLCRLAVQDSTYMRTHSNTLGSDLVDFWAGKMLERLAEIEGRAMEATQ